LFKYWLREKIWNNGVLGLDVLLRVGMAHNGVNVSVTQDVRQFSEPFVYVLGLFDQDLASNSFVQVKYYIRSISVIALILVY